MDQTFPSEAISIPQNHRDPASSPGEADPHGPASTRSEQAMLAALRTPGADGDASGPMPTAHDWPSLDDVSMCYIRTVLSHVGGNKAKAARILGMARRTLERILTRAKKGRSPAMHTRV